MLSRRPLIALAILVFAAPSRAADPTLTVNGVGGDNTAVVRLSRFEPLQISLTGDPGASFSVLVSLDADVTQPSGWALRPFTAATIFSPVHPVFDGIGTATIASALSLPTSDFIATGPTPAFRFGPSGAFDLLGVVPSVALLVDTDPATTPSAPFGPGAPIVLPLDEPVDLFLQVVALDPTSGALQIGNGITLDFGPPIHPGVVSYAEANGADATALGGAQSIGTLSSPDLGDGGLPTFDVAAGFAGSFEDATDVWMIQLAGDSELVEQATPPGENPDDLGAIGLLQGSTPEPEFLTGVRPARDGQNAEFPRIRLPGQRQLFHWRNATANPPAYGFGLIDEATGAITNLTPPELELFRGTSTRSPWEVQVAVSSDGDRALVILGESTVSHDRAFLLDLEVGGTFPNGFPATEITPPGGADFGTAFESSATFLRDDAGESWVVVAAASDADASPSDHPDHLLLAPATGGEPLGEVFPGPVTTGVTRIDRTLVLNDDEDVLCFVAGTAANDENVYAMRDLAADGGHVLEDITGFMGVTIGESAAATGGSPRVTALSRDGSRFAGVRDDGSALIPFTARTDGTDVGTVQDLVVDVAVGGKFDIDHYSYSTGLFLTDDGRQLLFHQGTSNTLLSDDLDLFVFDYNEGRTTNLTRTISGPGYDGDLQARLEGPWAPADAEFRPNVAYAGSFLGPDRRWRYFFRALKDLLPNDKLDLFAVSLETPFGQAGPRFEIANVTGSEFEPTPGVPAPPGAPSLRTDAGIFDDFAPEFFRLRRFGGNNVLANFYLLTGLRVDAPPGEGQVEQLFLFDGANPGPALQLTAFSPTSAPIAVSPTTKISSVTPNADDLSIAFVLDLDGNPASADQELVQLDLASFGAMTRLPEGPLTYDRAIAAGSLNWLGATQPALVWVEGSTARPAATTDGAPAPANAGIPIDATPMFLELGESTAVPLRTPGADLRVAFPFAVR